MKEAKVNKKEKEIIHTCVEDLIKGSEDCSFFVPAEGGKKSHRVIRAEHVLDCLGKMINALEEVEAEPKSKKRQDN